MKRAIFFLVILSLGIVAPVMAQSDVEVTDSTSGDWDGGQEGDIDINHPAVTITAKNYTRAYGEANPVFGYSTSGATLIGTPELSCEATVTSPVGTYPINVVKGTVENKNVTYVAGTLTITKAPLNIAAGTYTKKQGDPMPEFAFTYTGFKNNETKNVLTKQPVINCNATEASTPGEYPIIVSGAEARNYDISYTNGKLVIEENQTGIYEISVTHPADIFNLRGQKVRTQATTLKGLPSGIYIVNRKIVQVR
jgi:hypothetical protein